MTTSIISFPHQPDCLWPDCFPMFSPAPFSWVHHQALFSDPYGFGWLLKSFVTTQRPPTAYIFFPSSLQHVIFLHLEVIGPELVKLSKAGEDTLSSVYLGNPANLEWIFKSNLLC
uniref:Uncharacterized protein n=1 Tax=Pyxicephalus adspersus TaxID=30357 RepID=A0AAV3ACK2_PYXAD|nr:TPA: hypothetical protein GDO54_013144 [Pyxicephalus adspersus]